MLGDGSSYWAIELESSRSKFGRCFVRIKRVASRFLRLISTSVSLERRRGPRHLRHLNHLPLLLLLQQLSKWRLRTSSKLMVFNK